ncbi:MAG: flagellar basal body protein, partial [Succinivibrio sp.]|nr:flagellar basal body protein [Succinivibrio sp.]
MDLLHIGKYGVKNSAVLLDTTSNNISNVATTGYTRRRTNTYTSTVEWGVGETVTSRVYNVFVQRQMYEDLGAAKYYESYLSGLNAVDSMLSDTNMSMSTSFDSFFNSISDSVQTPTSLGAREEVLSELSIMANRFNTLNNAMQDEVVAVNSQIKEQIVSANEYLKA